VLDPTDVTGHYNYSRSLAALVQGFGMRDVWLQHHAERIYSHYTPAGATRIERFDASNALFHENITAEIVMAAFTDHHAVALKLEADVPTFRRGRGMWKMNTSLLTDAARKARFDQQWGLWTRQKRHFPKITMWWCRFVKKSNNSIPMRDRATAKSQGIGKPLLCMHLRRFARCTTAQRESNCVTPLQSKTNTLTKCPYAESDARH
jgi:hypothetical protein